MQRVVERQVVDEPRVTHEQVGILDASYRCAENGAGHRPTLAIAPERGAGPHHRWCGPE